MECAYCGVSEVLEVEGERELFDVFAGVKSLKTTIRQCQVCGFEEDCTADSVLLEAEAALAKAAVVTIINDLNAMGHTNVDLERIMRLPARTLARWRNDPSIMPSSAAVTLLKIVRTFPWLLEVMECGYDREKAKAIHLAHAVEELVEITGRFNAVNEKWAQKDLNLRPTDYESAALTN